MIVLVTWLWQGLAIACATAALLACAPRMNAATRHAIWWLACAAVLALPCAYTVSTPSAAAMTDAALPLPAGPDWLLALALAAWTAFAVAGVVRIARSLRSVRRLKSAGTLLDPVLASRLTMWQTASGRGPRPQLRVCDEAAGACALGLGRPVILVSRALVERLEEETLDAVVMHERAHLERRDDWWQLLQAIVRAIAGWHPALWYIGRRISLEREAACDDRVAVRSRDVRDYARALVEVAATRPSRRMRLDRLAIPGAATSASVLRRRVRRLLDSRLDRTTRLAAGATLASIALLGGTVTAAARLPALVVFVDAVTNIPHVRALRSSMPGFPAASGPVALFASAASSPLGGTRKVAFTQAAQPASPAGQPLSSIPPAESAAALELFPVAPADAAPLATARPASAAAIELPPSSTLVAAAPWNTAARSATSAGQGLARRGAVAGHRARDAGLSIGRFFSSAGKRVAGSF